MQHPATGSLPLRPLKLGRRTAYGVMIALVLAVYSYPALRTTLTTKCWSLPAISAPDLGVYLTISKLEKNQDGQILNPYYHIPVPSEVSFLKFRLGPILFGRLNDLFAGRVWWTLFFWNLLCWSLLCLAAIWLFDRALPQPTVALVMAGLSLLMLFSFEGVWKAVGTLVHLTPHWLPGGLPYLRPFSPQFIIPLLLCYLTLQIRALSEANVRAWGAMAIVQFVAFAAFPYATLMMAGITAVAAVWYLLAGHRRSAWRVVLGFLLVCALLDIAFALHGSASYGLSFPDQASLISFQPHLVGKSIGKLWVLTGILVAATAISGKIRPEVKWPLVGMGVSNMLFVLGDAFVSERAFQLSDHAGYFWQSTTVVLFVVLVSAYLPATAVSHRWSKVAALATVAICLVYGLLMAEGTYRTTLSYNIEQSDLASWLGRGQVSAQDLIITPFKTSFYDPCEWVPLLSHAEVLYCRNAQVTLTPEQNHDVQRFREVLYLYFTGKDRHWLETATDFERYGFYGELSSFRGLGERNERIVALREEMLPFFQTIESADPSIRNYFRRFRRVWIVQNRQPRSFVDAPLESYLDLKGQETVGGLLVTSAEPK